MHTVQLLLVEADTHQEAIAKAEERINSWEGHWSDWHDVGGRWKGIFGETNPDVINYKNDPDYFEDKLREFAEARKQGLKESLERYEASGKNISEMIDDYDPEKFEFNMESFYLKSIASVLAGNWTCDSSFYDVEAYSDTLVPFRERLAEHPEKQFAVAIDFHF